MNVLVISPEYPPFSIGGVGVHVEQIVKNLNSHNHKVKLITFFDKKKGKNKLEHDEENLMIFRVDTLIANLENEIENSFVVQNELIKDKLSELYNEGILIDIDLIVVHGYFLAEAALFAKEILNVPIVYHAHTVYALVPQKGASNLNAIHSAEEKLCNTASEIIAVSEYLKNLLIESFDIRENKVTVISKGVDIKKYDSIDAQPDESYYRILYVGRISEEKGVEVLLLALKKTISVISQKVLLFIAGTASSDLYLAHIKKIIKNLELQKNVIFLGFVNQENLIFEYKISNVVVVPSFEETFGRVAIEAMAARRTAIVSDVGGLGPIIRNNVTGYKFRAGDYKHLSQILTKSIVDNNCENIIGENAYKEALLKYSLESIYEQTEKVYFKVIR